MSVELLHTICYAEGAVEIPCPESIEEKMSIHRRRNRIYFEHKGQVYMGSRACGASISSNKICCWMINAAGQCKHHKDNIKLMKPVGNRIRCKKRSYYHRYFTIIDGNVVVMLKRICGVCGEYITGTTCYCAEAPDSGYEPDNTDEESTPVGEKRYVDDADDDDDYDADEDDGGGREKLEYDADKIDPPKQGIKHRRIRSKTDTEQIRSLHSSLSVFDGIVP